MQTPDPTLTISSNTLSMSGVGEASLVLGIIFSIISIIDATKQVYEAIKDEERSTISLFQLFLVADSMILSRFPRAFL